MSLPLLFASLASWFKAADQRFYTLPLSQNIASRQGRNLVHYIVYYAVNIYLANNICEILVHSRRPQPALRSRIFRSLRGYYYCYS
jgi:hypothetical protein